MRLIATENGQSFQRFLPDEVRPSSGVYVPEFFHALAVRYSFVTVPEFKNPMTEGAKFQIGRFPLVDGIMEIKELSVYSDGIIAAAYNTNDSDVIVNDVASLARDDFGFREPITHFPRAYVSSVIVELDHSIDDYLSMIEGLRDDFSSLVKDHYGKTNLIETTRLTIAADPMTLPPHTNFNFSIERRAGVPFSQNRYFSAASLSTAAHLDLLRRFDERLK